MYISEANEFMAVEILQLREKHSNQRNIGLQFYDVYLFFEHFTYVHKIYFDYNHLYCSL